MLAPRMRVNTFEGSPQRAGTSGVAGMRHRERAGRVPLALPRSKFSKARRIRRISSPATARPGELPGMRWPKLQTFGHGS